MVRRVCEASVKQMDDWLFAHCGRLNDNGRVDRAQAGHNSS